MEERVPLMSMEDGEIRKPKYKESSPNHQGGMKCDAKLTSFVIVGALTLIYVVGELGVAIYIESLVLLSDGFHNLSDVVSLYIAFWARQATKRAATDDMSYGWARTEILGGLTNGCFLLSLCLYVILESITKFIRPEPLISGNGLSAKLFMIVAGAGLGINTFGTILFAITGQEAHGHSHSHGHGHGHGHGHKDKDKKEKGHGHGHGHKDKEKKEKGHAHGHDHKHDDHEHDHDHDHDHDHEHDHDHDHEKKEKKDKDKKDKKKEKHGHAHGHDHKEKEKPKKKRDMNVHAVFLHYLGDAISSLMVLGTGILLYFFEKAKWVDYLDPVSSLLITGLILWTTIPLVKRCSLILLQSTPTEISVKKIRKKIMKIEGVLSAHDLHIWQLVDGMTIASLHVSVEEGADFGSIVGYVKKVLHKFGIHSSSIQPEFVARNSSMKPFCAENCVKDCEEDWCCKKSSESVAPKSHAVIEEFQISTEP